MITIPVAWRNPSQEQITTLDGRRYVLRLEWLGRIERWAFDLETEAGEVIARTKGLALRADLLRIMRYKEACPPGVLTVMDTEGDSEPSLESLGRRHVLVYFSGAPLASSVSGGGSSGGGAPPPPGD